jgi:hypothetical protein
MIGRSGFNCKTVKIQAGDCINKVESFAGGYQEYIKVHTRHGKKYTVGGWGKLRVKPSHIYDFGNKCMTGVFGRTNGHIVQLGYYYSDKY